MFIECLLYVLGTLLGLLDAVGNIKNKSDLFKQGTSNLIGEAIRDALRMWWKQY